MSVVRRVVAVLVLVGLCGGLPGGSVAAQETAAPGRVGSLADQVVTVGETLDVDVAEAFSGTVSAYAAVSSNPAVVSVSVEGSVVTLRGVARGYAYVRVTATNAAGSATQAITVDTELAEPPPQLARLLGSESTTVGAIAAFDLTPVFSGRVVSYGATSSDTAILDASVDGSIVILRGAGVGSATATVSATNLGGTESTSFTVTVGAARTPVAPPVATEEGLAAATAPTHCLTGEGTPITLGSTTGRTGIATIDIAYTVTDGTAPYVISSPDAATTATDPTGTLSVTCARSGIDPNNVHPTANAVESGPKTITLTVTDTNGRTNTTNITTQIVEDAYTTEYNNGTMQEGKTYILGDPDQWTLLTLPTGLNLQFEGISGGHGEIDAAYFSDTETGSVLVLGWGTGQELGRHVVTSGATARSAPGTPSVGELFSRAAMSAARPPNVLYEQEVTDGSNLWRPYDGLPAAAQVKIHPRMHIGAVIHVCDSSKVGQFDSAADHEEFKMAFLDAIAYWNTRLAMEGESEGISHEVFDHINRIRCTDETLQEIIGIHIIVHKRDQSPDPLVDIGGHEKQICSESAGCALTVTKGHNPPEINTDIRLTQRIVITESRPAFFESTIIHELGHFLGLGDYAYKCPVDGNTNIKSLYTYLDGVPSTEPDCITSLRQPVGIRDLEDLHAIYHPDALTDVQLVNDGGWEIHATLPLDVGRVVGPGGRRVYSHEFNAFGYVVWSRDLVRGGEWRLLGGVSRAEVAQADGAVEVNFIRDLAQPDSFTPSLLEFQIAGVTRDDWKRLKHTDGLAAGTEHANVQVEIDDITRHWMVGSPVRTWLPPSRPSIVYVHGGDGKARVFWYPVRGADDYEVFWDTGTGTRRESRRLYDNTTFFDVENLTNGTRYSFRVKAYIGTTGSELSTPRSATPAAVAAPGGVAWTTATATSGSLGWRSVTGVELFEVRSQRTAASSASDAARQAGAVDSPADEEIVRTSDLSQPFNGLLPDSTYVFAVRSVVETSGDFGVETTVSEWSDSVSVTTPAVSALDDPAGPWVSWSAPLNYIEWSWGAVTGATNYDVEFAGGGISHSSRLGRQLRIRLTGISTGSLYTFRVKAVNTATGAESDWVSVSVRTGPAPELPPPGLEPPATPAFTSVSTTSTEVSLEWGAVDDAASYSLERDGIAVVNRRDVTSFTDTDRRPVTTYRYRVQAHNAAGDSAWALREVTTDAAVLPPPLPPEGVSVTGQVRIRRMTPTQVGGWTLSLRYVTDEGTEIKPEHRFTRFEDLETTWQYTSTVEATVDGHTRELGRVAYRKTTETGERIEIGFRPLGSTTVETPAVNKVNYSAMVIGTWYSSSSFTFTLEDSAGASSDTDAALAGGLAGALAPGDVACADCLHIETDLEP